MNTELWAIGLVLASGMIGGMGPIYFQRGARIMNLRKPSTIYKNYYLIIGIFVYGLSTLLFIPALKGGELSVLYPMVGLVYVWVSIYSVILLKERMNLLKWTGIGLLLLGVAMIGVGA